MAVTAAFPRPPTPMHATFSLLLGETPFWLRITNGKAAMADAAEADFRNERRERRGFMKGKLAQPNAASETGQLGMFMRKFTSNSVNSEATKPGANQS